MQRKNMITAAQIRAARGLLDWTRKRLAEESGVPRSTLADFEAGRTDSMLTKNAGKLETALNRAGVVFLDSPEHYGAALLRKIDL